MKRSTARHDRVRRHSFRPGFGSFLALIVVFGVGTFFISNRISEAPAPLDEPLHPDAEWEATWGPSSAFCERAMPPLVCAHGGDINVAAPNTIGAIRGVPYTGAKCVEIDASRTKDGQLVTIHNRELAELLDIRSANVGDFTLDELVGLDPRGSEKIPTLYEALRMALSLEFAMITVDTKPGPPRHDDLFAADVLAVLEHANCSTTCQVWAKSDKIVQDTASLSPSTQAGYVVMNQTEQARLEGADKVARLREASPRVAATYYGMVDQALVAEAHSLEREVHAWTVNDPVAMRQVLNAGVDAIVTNFPTQIQAAVTTLQAKCRAETDGPVDLRAA
ncbi:hypothetical protein CYMTET_10437 [Cymbomonas tetramitiformis]|uniref:glycerophosphodiester phosphodiesterase n=1 Tax=Cymbomonas tetramitiformis TaxID=36881 RepID=A0AAE0LDV0_9CHLO|nr:hypothetical protein CYMTET_10437 [Cymbomonas tetramitiformis]